MPTATGLPKVGEVWERTNKLPVTGKPGEWDVTVTRFLVLARSGGTNWSLTVHVKGDRQARRLWTEVSYWHSKGDLKYIGQAGPETKKKWGLS